METLYPKIFFQLEILVDKTTFSFYLYNKVNYFVTTQYTTAIFYPFYLNSWSWLNDNGIQLVYKNYYTIQERGE